MCFLHRRIYFGIFLKYFFGFNRGERKQKKKNFILFFFRSHRVEFSGGREERKGTSHLLNISNMTRIGSFKSSISLPQDYLLR